MDIIFAFNEERATKFIKEVEGKDPIFICVIASTDTAKIPGISAAGKYPELTEYTPPADVELLLRKKCICIKGVPVTPEGIPTPALITMSAIDLADIPCFVVASGLRVKPNVPFIELGGKPGSDIRTGKAVEDAEELIEKGELVGHSFSKIADYVVIGESIPGGTTTALGVLLAMGIDAENKVSSSMRENPHDLKIKVVKEGMKRAGIKFGDLKDDPIRAISCVGDPMLPAFAGIVIGAAERCPVLMAGGTQMGAVLAIVKAIKPEALNKVAIGTTKWIIQDRTSDIKGIISQIDNVPILAVNLDFSSSRFYGLRAYEEGVVKEGVGAGGISIAAMLKSKGSITKEILFKEVEMNYERILRTA